MAHSKSAARWTKSTDEELRPWANNPDLFESYQQLVDAKNELAKTIADTSYIRLSGNSGDSELDPKPKEIVEIESLFRTAELAYQLAQQIEILPETKFIESSKEEVDNEAVTVDGNADEEENNMEEATDQFHVEDVIPVTMPSVPISTVKYVGRKGPAIANMSYSMFRKLLKAVQAGDSTLNFSEVRDKLNSSLRVFPKHFSGKHVKLDESIDVGSALIITKKHSKGQFSDSERSPKQKTVQDDSNFLHFSGNNTDPNNIITNKSPFPKPAEVYIMSRPRTGLPEDNVVDRLYRPHSVGVQVARTAQRDEACNSVQLSPLVLPFSMLTDRPSSPVSILRRVDSTTPSPTKLTPLPPAATASTFSSPTSSVSTNFIKETPRSTGFFAMMTEVPELGDSSIPGMRASSPKRPKSSLIPAVGNSSGSRLGSPKKSQSSATNSTTNSRLSSPVKRVNFLKSSTPKMNGTPRSRQSTPGTPNGLLSASLPRLNTGSRTL